MKKSWGLTSKIITGQKKIESRWYSVKYKPWDKIKKGDTIYFGGIPRRSAKELAPPVRLTGGDTLALCARVVHFKDSGNPIKIKEEVARVIQFSGLTPQKVKEILERYGEDDGLEREKIADFYNIFKGKKYCILIFLKNQKIVKLFKINKKSFGAMASWITIKSINHIKI